MVAWQMAVMALCVTHCAVCIPAASSCCRMKKARCLTLKEHLSGPSASFPLFPFAPAWPILVNSSPFLAFRIAFVCACNPISLVGIAPTTVFVLHSGGCEGGGGNEAVPLLCNQTSKEEKAQRGGGGMRRMPARQAVVVPSPRPNGRSSPPLPDRAEKQRKLVRSFSFLVSFSLSLSVPSRSCSLWHSPFVPSPSTSLGVLFSIF